MKYWIFVLVLYAYSFGLNIDTKGSYFSGSLIKIPIKLVIEEDLNKAMVNGEEVPIHFFQKEIFIIIANDVQYYSSSKIIEIQTKNGKTHSKKIKIVPIKASHGYVNLDVKTARLASDKKKAKEENQFFHSIFLMKRKTLKLSKKWIHPLKGNHKKTSSYGKKRTYSDGRVSFHRGVDFISDNKNIYASNDGIVVFAGKKKIRGNIVVIYHALGLYTSYWHLDEIVVKSGDFISQGKKLGVIGSTGVSTAPHLHWEARLNNTTFNALDLLTFL